MQQEKGHSELIMQAASINRENKNMASTQRNIKFVALALMALAPAIQALAESNVAKSQGYKTVSDVLYRDGDGITDYIKERCRLDVYYPADVRGFATVVWFHGGGLTAGNRFVPSRR